MTHIAVDTVELRSLAEAVRAAAQEVEGATAGGLEREVAALVEPGLVRALSGFVERWGGALAGLADDAHRLADGLDLASALYGDAERAMRSSVVAMARGARGGG